MEQVLKPRIGAFSTTPAFSPTICNVFRHTLARTLLRLLQSTTQAGHEFVSYLLQHLVTQLALPDRD